MVFNVTTLFFVFLAKPWLKQYSVANYRNQTPRLIQLLKNYEIGDVQKTVFNKMTPEQIEAGLKLKCFSTRDPCRANSRQLSNFLRKF